MKKRLVIIGGGFSGSYIAKKLQNTFQTTLIDSKDYFEFTPGILRTLIHPKHLKKIQSLHSNYLKNINFIKGSVSEVSKKFVKVNNKKIPFDYLVVSSGSRYEFPIKEQNLVLPTRAKNLESHTKKLLQSKKILIVGGGLVGVELAAEISTFYKDKDLTLIHSDSSLVPRNNNATRAYSEYFLKLRKVKIIFNKRMESKKDLKPYDLVFLCTGIKPNFEFMKKNFKSLIDSNNQLKVNKTLQLQNNNNIFVCGDISSQKEEKTAQNAEAQAKVVVSNLQSLENKQPLKHYKSKKRVLVISLGKYNGIIEYKNFSIKGIIPAFLKYLIERKSIWEHS